MDRGSEQTFFQRRYEDDQQTLEKMFSITKDWRNENQNQMMSLYIIQNDQLSKRQHITSAGGDVGKWEPSALSVGMCIGAAATENVMECSQKNINGTTVLSRNSTSGFFPEESKKINSERYMHTDVQCSIIYSRKYMEAI